jgi:RNA polymerase sigma-70 factor (ECF subfamily)
MAALSMTVWPIPPTSKETTKSLGPQLEPPPIPDAALVDAAKMGDRAAFERLIKRKYQFCLSKAYSILRNRADAEDEAQNACAQAWTHLWQFQRQGSFDGWLSRIVSNQCLMRLRERKGALMISVDELFDTDGISRLEVIDQRALPEEAVGADEVASVIFQEIHRVPRLLQEVLVMRYLGRLPLRDIAARLGISITAAKSRLMRARIELRLRLAKHQGKTGCSTLFRRSTRPQAAYVRAI